MVNKKISFLTILGFLFLPLVSFAQLVTFCGGATGTPCISGYRDIVNSIEMVVAVLFGVVVVICFIMAGILFLTARGEPDKLKAAKSAVIWGAVGVVVGILAYSIVMIVGSFLV